MRDFSVEDLLRFPAQLPRLWRSVHISSLPCAEDDEEVPLMEVKSDILEKVIEYMKHYQTDKPAEIEKVRDSSVVELQFLHACTGNECALVSIGSYHFNKSFS